MSIRVTVFAFLAVAAVLIAGCGTGSHPSPAPGEMRLYSASGRSATPIQHVVLMIQENRSFNDFFATYPGTDGTTTGQAEPDPSCSPPIDGGSIALTEMPLDLSLDMNHTWRTGYSIAYDGGKMDAFDKVKFGNGEDECSYPYQYT